MPTAPSCPVSFGQPYPGQRVFLKGDPWTRTKDPLQQIPWANDLRSALLALNMMAKLIADILHNGPHVNNIHDAQPPDTTEQGQNNNPNYAPHDWIEESRVYRKQELKNPDDQEQSIEIKVISSVDFYNQNTSYRLHYGA